MVTRWFEHEHLTDDLATLAFAGQWIRVLDSMLKRCGMDCREDAKGDPVPLPFLYQGSTVEYFKQFRDGEDWLHFERLRKLCDREMLPYRFFCDIAASVLLGMDGYPIEIASIRDCMVLNSVMEEVRSRLGTGPVLRSKHEFFQVKNFTQHPVQVVYFLWLLRAIKEKYGPRSSEVLGKMIEGGTMVGFDNFKKEVDVK